MTNDPSPPIDVYAPPKAVDAPPEAARSPQGRPPLFFAVSPLKLVVMSICTGGAYEVFWIYANWSRMRRRGHRVSPFWRTFFAYFTCYALFRTVKQTAVEANVNARFSPGLLAMAWIVTTLFWRLPGLAWIISFASVVFLIPVQMAMNGVNRALYPDHDPNARFTAWNIAGIVLGGALLVLIFVGEMLPDQG